MPKFESLKPAGVMASKLSFHVKDAGSSAVLVYLQSYCACIGPIYTHHFPFIF